MDTPDLFEDPLSEYCKSPSPTPSTASSVVQTPFISRRKKSLDMIPDFSNRRGDQKISDVIANKFKKTKPKPVTDARFVRQNIKKWNIDIRRRRNSDSLGNSSQSSVVSCPRHSPAAQNKTLKIPVRQRSYSSGRQDPVDATVGDSPFRNSAQISRGLSEDDLQKLDKISNLFEAFKCPIDVAAGKRADVLKRMKDRGGETVPLSRLMDGNDEVQ